jgi:hypothetical protein
LRTPELSDASVTWTSKVAAMSGDGATYNGMTYTSVMKIHQLVQKLLGGQTDTQTYISTHMDMMVPHGSFSLGRKLS